MTPNDPEYQRFYGNEGVWQNTLHPEAKDEHPTISTVTIHHEDQLVNGKDYFYRILHVRGWFGKGFMATVRFIPSPNTPCNGDVHYGTTEAAYEVAVLEAKRLLAKRQKELDEKMELA